MALDFYHDWFGAEDIKRCRDIAHLKWKMSVMRYDTTFNEHIYMAF
jgi:uncharacterized glyoxalase superfamily protein PhnB